MKIVAMSLLVVVLVLSTVHAFPAFGDTVSFKSTKRSVFGNTAKRDDLPVGQWAAPGPGDVRSPCPGLNTLANHGYLPRNGQAISAKDIVTAMDQYLGIKSDFGLLQVAGAAVRGVLTNTPHGFGLKSFQDLTNSHNVIEHDASFTRDDLNLGSNAVINQTLIDQLVSFSSDGVVLTPDELAAARHARLKDSFSRNPSPVLQKEQTDGCWREESLIRLVVGDKDGNIPINYLEEWFRNERLPTSLGWSPRSPSAGIIANIFLVNDFENKEKSLNSQDHLPIQF